MARIAGKGVIMEYCDLRPAVEAYKNGLNVMSTLRQLLGAAANNDSIVEIAYDLQAGSYARFVDENRDYWNSYSDEVAQILRRYVAPGTRVLDVGTGEMTTMAGVAMRAFTSVSAMYACDISFSRIRLGRSFVQRTLEASLGERLHSFVGNMFRLPFLDSSVDVVWTSHALEPNGGQELLAVSELLRVASQYLVMFEPSYESNSDEGRRRMDSLGYIKGLPETIEKAGGKLLDVVSLRTVSNPLNPTHAYICRKTSHGTAIASRSPWACPATRLEMHERVDHFFSPGSRLAYPILAGIPVLRAEQAILASALE